MASALLLEFDGVDKSQYDAVNKELGIDPATGKGDWPKGMVSHVGSLHDAGLIVVEVWDSQDDQAAFLADRLGPALGKIGLPDPSRMVWGDAIGSHST